MSGDYLNYFIGGVPPQVSFEMHIKELEELINAHGLAKGTTVVPRISFIGLIAYFETFCKETAAAVINIHPNLIHDLKKGSYSTSIDCVQLESYGFNINKKVGSLITENYDFGDAKKINAFFKCLFNKDSFSKKEIREYGKILAERNLIVHNGGTYTTKYIKQHHPEIEIENNAFWHSLKFEDVDFIERLAFLRNISQKITNNAFDGMKMKINGDESEMYLNAIEALLWEY